MATSLIGPSDSMRLAADSSVRLVCRMVRTNNGIRSALQHTNSIFGICLRRVYTCTWRLRRVVQSSSAAGIFTRACVGIAKICVDNCRLPGCSTTPPTWLKTALHKRCKSSALALSCLPGSGLPAAKCLAEQSVKLRKIRLLVNTSHSS